MQLYTSDLRPPALEARHNLSGYGSVISDSRLSFAEYVARTRGMLQSFHSGRRSADLEIIVDGNAPFELKPADGFESGQNKIYRRGVLLTHGLSDSPYFMRNLGDFFQQRGFRVMAVLLPGHGTQPGDLLDAVWQEWARTVAYGVDRLADEVEEVYLAGFSAGGTLSVYHSLLDQRVRGLFLFSPALRISSKAALARFHKLYSWLVPSAKWLDLKPDRDIYKYESFPKNAAVQMYALTGEVKNLLRGREMDIPVFAAASADDVTVDTSATVEFIAEARHASSRLVLYTSDPSGTLPGIPAEKLELVNSVVPGQRILGSSHLAMLLPADDVHYGLAGDYSNCIHYYPGDIEKYAACINNPQTDFQGELTQSNLKAGVLRRLMYNPNFLALKDSMNGFIDDLP